MNYQYNNIQKYNHWKALQFLKENGEYERYIKEIEISLVGRGLTYVPKEIFYLKELKGLFLNNNQISYIPENISHLKGLEVLYLNHNQISHVPKEISKLKDNLKFLWLKNNPLEQKEKEIKNLLPRTMVYTFYKE